MNFQAAKLDSESKILANAKKIIYFIWGNTWPIEYGVTDLGIYSIYSLCFMYFVFIR